ncbi:similar to Naumovozyma castellii NCAS_0J02330 hypothetical protein [Maudiozyma saulgeensis]|uniref:Hyphally-regulated cell wall protein N-terminal domain-containing protein n=1 Tax=Maudiozyma saulgeensis TaxID=1789683 RepID=A0A1X7R7Q4_9SACH|nr:similar to Naumovozyma castellii NCAS_0J02330 hypothetical protein [Kazachstania saulgeensis]
MLFTSNTFLLLLTLVNVVLAQTITSDTIWSGGGGDSSSFEIDFNATLHVTPGVYLGISCFDEIGLVDLGANVTIEGSLYIDSSNSMYFYYVGIDHNSKLTAPVTINNTGVIVMEDPTRYSGVGMVFYGDSSLINTGKIFIKEQYGWGQPWSLGGFTNKGLIVFDNIGGRSNDPLSLPSTDDFDNPNVLIASSTSPESGINDGTLYVTNSVLEWDYIYGSGCIMLGSGGIIKISMSSSSDSLFHNQTVYLEDDSSAFVLYYANDEASFPPLTVAGFGSGEYLGCGSIISNYSYDDTTGILSVTAGSYESDSTGGVNTGFNIGPGYDSALFSIFQQNFTENSPTGEEMVFDWIQYDGAPPNPSRPLVCAAYEEPPMLPYDSTPYCAQGVTTTVTLVSSSSSAFSSLGSSSPESSSGSEIVPSGQTSYSPSSSEWPSTSSSEWPSTSSISDSSGILSPSVSTYSVTDSSRTSTFLSSVFESSTINSTSSLEFTSESNLESLSYTSSTTISSLETSFVSSSAEADSRSISSEYTKSVSSSNTSVSTLSVTTSGSNIDSVSTAHTLGTDSVTTSTNSIRTTSYTTGSYTSEYGITSSLVPKTMVEESDLHSITTQNGEKRSKNDFSTSTKFKTEYKTSTIVVCEYTIMSTNDRTSGITVITKTFDISSIPTGLYGSSSTSTVTVTTVSKIIEYPSLVVDSDGDIFTSVVTATGVSVNHDGSVSTDNTDMSTQGSVTDVSSSIVGISSQAFTMYGVSSDNGAALRHTTELGFFGMIYVILFV